MHLIARTGDVSGDYRSLCELQPTADPLSQLPVRGCILPCFKSTPNREELFGNMVFGGELGENGVSNAPTARAIYPFAIGIEGSCDLCRSERRNDPHVA